MYFFVCLSGEKLFFGLGRILLISSFSMIYAYNYLFLLMTGVWLKWTASKVSDYFIAFMTVLTCWGLLRSPVRFRWSSRWFRLMNLVKLLTSWSLSMASISRLTYCNYRLLPNDWKRRLFWRETVLFQLISRFLNNEFFFIISQIAINSSLPRFNFGISKVYSWFSIVLSILRSGEMVLSLDLQPTRARWVSGFSPCFSASSFIRMFRVFWPSSLFLP